MNKYKGVKEFIDNMVIKIGEGNPDHHTTDFLWKLGNYRFKNEVTVRSTSNYKDQVLNYHVSHQTKINGHFVAPIIITRRGKTGYIPLTNGNGDPINIYMTKEEVDTFNQNFTEKDYDQINHYSLFGNYKTTINNTGE